MDIGELLRFKPDKPGSSSDLTGFKRSAPKEANGALGEYKQLTSDAKAEKIQKLIDNEPAPEAIEELSVKKMILQFEKKTCKNQEMRIKFADNPEKFMKSEVELHDSVQQLHVLATAPQFYPIIAELNSVASLLSLLSHDNIDITIVTIDLLQEMTDIEVSDDTQEAIDVFIDVLLKQQLFAILADCLSRMDEGIKEESDCVHNILSIVENITELRPSSVIDCTNQGIMDWLLKRLKAKIPFDGNKLFTSEILAILLQGERANREALGVKQGLDIVLQQLAYFKKHNPNSPEEYEFMENLFGVLCSCLLIASNKPLFLKGEGLQLMNLMLREKKASRVGAVKVLNFATLGDSVENCNKLVDILALRSLFPLFMKTPKVTEPNKKGKNNQSAKMELEEHLVSIISSMVQNCTGTQKERLMNKFTESEYEKVERLMELHFKYKSRIQKVDDEIETEKKALAVYGNELDQLQEEQYYLQRIECGLFVLQRVDLTVIALCAGKDDIAYEIYQRVNKILNMKGSSSKGIIKIINEYLDFLGDEDSSKEEITDKRIRIEKLLKTFKNPPIRSSSPPLE